MEDIDNLINNLNERGVRESELKDKLINERDRLAKSLKRMSTITENLCSGKNTIKAEN